MKIAGIRAFFIAVVAVQLVFSSPHQLRKKRMINADDAANIGEFPGQVSLQDVTGRNGCGGVLIDDRHILTAAHCHQKYSKINFVTAMGGDVSILKHGSKSRQTRKISDFIIHRHFSNRTLENDIAIIRVSKPFKVTDALRPMKLSRKSPKGHTVCTAVGWGTTSSHNTTSSKRSRTNKLLKAQLSIVRIKKCQSRWKREIITKNMICARNTSSSHYKGPCYGDSGGLLTCRNGEVSGIISFVPDGCEDVYYPSVYTDVSKYRGWIKSIVKKKTVYTFEEDSKQ